MYRLNRQERENLMAVLVVLGWEADYADLRSSFDTHEQFVKGLNDLRRRAAQIEAAERAAAEAEAEARRRRHARRALGMPEE